ncbi:MAG: tripartite tricarboxylate transporter substrate binding protein [Betaproteobacteria bacterium]|nr:tripartite tricarboxylate transporter substrate binding protein [Betaproteobacteria bacterium]
MSSRPFRCASFTPFAVVLCLLGAATADAQQYPNRPIRLIVGYPPGGPADITARLVAPYLTEALGQQIVIDNRAGAGGTVAATLTARAEPDGYTISIVANGEMAISPNLRKLPYDPLKDFETVSRIGANQLALVVHPSVQAKSVAELVALAKAKPGTVNFASAGTGSTAHLAGELFKSIAGIDIVHVPYKGAGPALIDLIGGQVHMLITGYPGALPHIKAGRLRALGATGPKRMIAAPDLPTISETVKGYDVTSSYGLVLPLRTPKAIVARLHRETAAIVKKPEVREKLIALGFDPEGNTPAEFAAQIKSELAKWAKVIKIANVKVE